jgi:predicted DsbA family dithiol-disulfide isomerase
MRSHLIWNLDLILTDSFENVLTNSEVIFDPSIHQSHPVSSGHIKRSFAIASMTSTAFSRIVPVTITSDLMCPWCWVGLRKLQQASEEASIGLKIVWKPFLLRPDHPLQGVPKGGTPQSRVPGHLKAAGKAVGIDFTGLTDSTPNTIDFHAVMKYLLDAGVDQTPFQEAVFRAYFTQGIFPDHDALLTCAESVGVQEQVKSVFEQTEVLVEYRREVVAEARDASMKGIRGVPSFTFGDDARPAFSGAQAVETFVSHLEKHAGTAVDAS